MELRILPYELSICKIEAIDDIDMAGEFFFLGRTDEEISLVCITDDAPDKAIAREDGWKALRIEGVLDFSLVGILSGISSILAESGISMFAVSTYNTDYILVKEDAFNMAVRALEQAGYKIS